MKSKTYKYLSMVLKKKNFWLGVVSLVWLSGIIVGYFVTHKPFSPQLAVHLGLILWRLMISGLVVSLSGGIGSLFIRTRQIELPAVLFLQSAAGIGFLSLSILFLGVTIGISNVVLGIWLLVLWIFFYKDCIHWVKEWSLSLKKMRPESTFEFLLLMVLSFMLVFALLIALAPPVKYDALMYHLSLPHTYLMDGGIRYLPWIIMTGMPQVAEMMFTWVSALGGYEAAPTLGWGLAVVGLIGFWGYLYQRFDRRTAWIGLSSLMAGYSLVVTMSWGYVDWFGLLFGMGTLISLDVWRRHGDIEMLILTGVFAGFALGTKYTSAVLIFISSGALLWHIWKKKLPFFRTVFFFGVPILLVSSPWFLKNFFSTGNPFYPFFIESGAMTRVRLDGYQGLTSYGNWLDIVLLPLRATISGVGGDTGYSTSIGPLMIGFGTFFWLGWRSLSEKDRGSLENAAVFAVLGWIFWAVGNQLSGFLIQTRYYYSLFPSLVYLAAAGFWGIKQLVGIKINLAWLASVLVLFVLCLNLIDIALDTFKKGAPQMVFQAQSEEEYLVHNLGWFYPAMQEIQRLPEGSIVLLLFETRSFYCLPKCRPDEILDRWKRDWRVYRDPAAVLEAWTKEGFTHILFYEVGADFMRRHNDPHYNQDDWLGLDSFIQILPSPQEFGKSYRLYDLNQ